MPKARVLVVDDSVVMRGLIGAVLDGHPDIEVLGAVANGKLALSRLERERPDLITLDVEMPEMDGLTALTEIHRLYPQIPVVMFSTLTQRGGEKTLDALARGAVDYVPKPANVGSLQESIDRLRSELIPKILAFTRQGPAGPSTRPRNRPAPNVRRPIKVVAMASSTGGPNALQTVLTEIPGDFPVPILIVQHMPPLFTALLAKRLNDICPITVVEAAEGMAFHPGSAYIAPGGRHFEVRTGPEGILAHMHEGPPENSCRPAADVLFRSVAKAWGGAALCVVMTGMGQDGKLGAHAIREAGGSVIAQDRDTSVVWGMPGSVVEAQLADDVLPLPGIAPALKTRLQKEWPHAAFNR